MNRAGRDIDDDGSRWWGPVVGLVAWVALSVAMGVCR